MRTFSYRAAFIVWLLILLRLDEQPVAAVNVTNGLIHLWHMDEQTGSSVADSIGSWNFQLQGGAMLGASGMEGFGVRLDGTNDFMTTAPAAANFLSSDFTLSLWMKWGSLSGKPGILQFKSNTGLRNLSIDLSYPDVRPFVYTSLNPGSLQFSSTVSIGDGRWHLLSLVRQGTSGRLYLDAVQVGTGSGTLTHGTNDIFELGKNDATHFFSGIVDEAAIYGRALSPAEIAANSIPEPGAVMLLTLCAALFLRPGGVRRYRRQPDSA